MLTARIVIACFALLYGALALWCAVAMDTTATALGFVLSNDAARSEYLTVYVGLEAGLALFFGLSACGDRATLTSASLLALCSSGALACTRTISLALLAEPGGITWIMLVVEWLLTVLAAATLYGLHRQTPDGRLPASTAAMQ